jgi:hypothetical protein
MKLGALALVLLCVSAFDAGRARAAPEAPRSGEQTSLQAGQEQAPTPQAAPSYRRVSDWLLLLTGAALGFVAHEAGHLSFDLAVGNDPEFRRVSLGPFPFVAISPRNPHSNNERYSSAMLGFMVEAAYTEAIFARNPELRHRHKPLLEGMLAFHVALDLGYAITGFANIGPAESDVNTMARAAGIPRWGVALMLAAPLAFDVLRYVRPDTRRWSMWLGLGARLPMFAVALAI